MMHVINNKYILLIDSFQMGVFKIVTGWWGHQPGQAAVVGVPTDHSFMPGQNFFNLNDSIAYEPEFCFN